MARRPRPRLDLKDPEERRDPEAGRTMRQEVRKRHGTNLTYEQRRDAATAVMADALWADESKDLNELTTDDDEVDIGGTRYRRLGQPSSAIYFGRWGTHEVREALHRQVGLHMDRRSNRSSAGSAWWHGG